MTKLKELYSIICLAVLFAGGLLSCQHDHTEFEGDNGKGMKDVHFSVSLPNYSNPALPKFRSMGNKEYLVENLKVLVFELNSSNNEVLLYKGDVSEMEQTADRVSFTLSLHSGSDYNIVLLANIDAAMGSVIDGFSKGDYKTDILSALEIDKAGKWEADGSTPGGYTAIPMYGETGRISISLSSSVVDMKLMRMLSRIDVGVQASNFTLNNVYLCNYNTRGYMSPKWDSSGLVEMGVATSPNLPSDPAKQTGISPALHFPVSANSITEEIYTFESAAASETVESDRKDATCLVVEGTYNGAVYFYRIDFTYSSGTDKSKYMPLLRNHKYIVSITSADGIGYQTLQEALDSYTVKSNLRTNIISYDEGEMKDLNFNGQYMLSFSDDSYLLNGADNTLSFAFLTDYIAGAEIVSITDDEEGTSNCSWISVPGGTPLTSAKGETRHVTLNVDTYSGDMPRTAYISIVAGRLKANIEIIQYSGVVEDPSNCYIIKPSSVRPLLIPISRAEEGIPGSLSRRNNLSGKFIWTDSPTGMSSQSTVKGVSIVGKGRKAIAVVEVGNKEGNAVVAVADKNTNKIKWSWHIWVTDYDPSLESGYFMDRNLGALNNGSGDWWASRGLFYQWGRKDPLSYVFEKKTSPTVHSPIYAYDADGNIIDFSNLSINDLKTSVENPTVYADGVSVSWQGSAGAASWGDGTKKSVFDPSPKGWRVVADLDVFQKELFATNVFTWNTGNNLNYEQPGYDAGRQSDTQGGFYPGAGGIFFGSNSQEVVNNDVAKVGYYWVAKQSNSTTAQVFKITNTVIKDSPFTSLKNRGFSVRAVRE